MNKKQLQAMARELAKDIKTGEDLSTLSAELTKLTVEAALNAELENHLGYSRHACEGHNSGNSRNGIKSKFCCKFPFPKIPLISPDAHNIA